MGQIPRSIERISSCNYLLMCNILHAEFDVGCWHPWVWLGCIGLGWVGSFCGLGWDLTNEICLVQTGGENICSFIVICHTGHHNQSTL